MEIVNEWDWSSHQPLIKTLVEVFRFGYILELGVGKYSTPIFLEQNADLVCIENDPKWMAHVQAFVGDAKNVQFLYHRLSDHIKPSTKSYELSEAETSSVISYYKELGYKIAARPKSELKLLFVDQFACLRTHSINTMYDKFDVISYHDCEPNGIPWYSYHFVDGLLENYVQYKLVTPISWTGCFIKKTLPFDPGAFKTKCYAHCIQFCKENTLPVRGVLPTLQGFYLKEE